MVRKADDLAESRNLLLAITAAARTGLGVASIKVRATQIKSALLAAQLAPALFQLRRAVRAKSLRMFTRQFRFSPHIIRRSLFIHAHPRNIPPRHPAHKWKTIFLSVGFSRSILAPVTVTPP
jgi:hypothetical protein